MLNPHCTGSESEARVPPEFIVQHNTVANPPMFFYVIQSLLARGKEEDAEQRAIDEALRRFYPRLKVWYAWLNSSQAGHAPGASCIRIYDNYNNTGTNTINIPTTV